MHARSDVSPLDCMLHSFSFPDEAGWWDKSTCRSNCACFSHENWSALGDRRDPQSWRKKSIWLIHEQLMEETDFNRQRNEQTCTKANWTPGSFQNIHRKNKSWTKTMLADATTRPADKPLADLTAEVLGEANEAAMTPRWDVVGGCVDGEEISCHFVNAASCPLIWSEVEKHVNARTVAVTEEDKLNCPTS